MHGHGIQSGYIKSGVKRSRDVLTLVNSEQLNDNDLSLMTSAGNKRDIVFDIPNAFSVGIAPHELARTIKEFIETVHSSISNKPTAANIICSTFALFAQELWWRILPSEPRPLILSRISMDIDYCSVVLDMDYQKLLNVASIYQWDSTTTTMEKYLKYWGRRLRDEVLCLSDEGCEVITNQPAILSWTDYLRQRVWGLSVWTKKQKEGFINIPTTNAHQDPCHMSLRPHSEFVNRSTLIDLKKKIFECAYTVSNFINKYYHTDLSAENKFMTQQQLPFSQRATMRVYNGPLMPLLVSLLFPVMHRTKVTLTMQTFGGKASNLSVMVDTFDLLRDPNQCGTISSDKIRKVSKFRLYSIFHRFTITLDKPNVASSVNFELGVGATVEGKIAKRSCESELENAFVAFGIEQENKEEDVDNSDDGDDDDDDDDAGEVGEKEVYQSALGRYHPFSSIIPNKNIVNNLTKWEIQTLTSEYTLSSNVSNVQLYSPTLNNVQLPDLRKAYSVSECLSDVTGILNSSQIFESSNNLFTQVCEQLFCLHIGYTYRGFNIENQPPPTLGRIEMRVCMSSEEDICKAFKDVALLCAKATSGFSASDSYLLALFSEMALLGSQLGRIQMESILHEKETLSEWYSIMFELQAQAYQQLSGQSRYKQFQFLPLHQKSNNRPIYNPLNNQHRKVLCSILNKHLHKGHTFDVVFKQILQKNTSMGDIGDLADQLRNSLDVKKLQLLSPLKQALQRKVALFFDKNKSSCLYCKHCRNLFRGSYVVI